MSTISSWRWVLEDLSKRLKDGIDALQYEHHALTVVIDRIVEELKGNCKPGALTPMSDDVELAIMQVKYNINKDRSLFLYFFRVSYIQKSCINFCALCQCYKMLSI